MSPFRFSRERLLDLRRLQAEGEARALEALQARRAALEEAQAALAQQARGEQVALIVPGARSNAGELASLESYRYAVQFQQRRLAEAGQALTSEIEGQRRKLVEARRRVRLLERLREHQFAAWQAEMFKELDELASDVYLAAMPRSRKLR